MDTISITPLDSEYISDATGLFNKYAENELPYKSLDIDSWKALFYTSDEKVMRYIFQAISNNQLVGFAAGCCNLATGNCYITFVLVAAEYRQNGIGRLLLGELETALSECRKSENVLCEYWESKNGLNEHNELCKLQITFFNPCALTWIVPGTSGHDHPNAPGVDVDSAAFEFFKAMGYEPYVYQNSFYLPLSDYTEPSFISDKKEWLLNQGITLEYYDNSRHYGLEVLCDDLGNPVWKEELPHNDALGSKGHPLMAIIRENKIIGFTGPLRVQESGRGYFAGIGVHSECRGLGLGTVLFNTLCTSLKDLGAEYMTLFTGTDNPAGQIYQNAGFKIVKTWADMEKGC